MVSRHLEHDMQEAYHRLLALSGQVEEMIVHSVRSLTERSAEVAQSVIDRDTEIDRVEVRIEEECLKMLALHQPVAADLRLLTTMMKINNDLERMADLACNIAERAQCLRQWFDFPIPDSLGNMVEITTNMVRSSIDAFVSQDVDAAYRVISRDQSVDSLNVEVIEELTDIMQREPQSVPPALHCFSAARHLERIADHATNVAEDVVYMVSGVIVRHRQLPPTK